MNRLLHYLRRALALAMLSGFSALPASAAPAVPMEAEEIIRQVHAAAKRKDVAALKNLMVSEFVWSFGGDGDANQALAAWEEDPVAFQQLYRVTGRTCAVKSGGTVECPRNGDTHYRAGFRETSSGWRMVYFVAGD